MRDSKFFVKKSFNLAVDLEGQIDAYVRKNPGVSFTLLMNQALRCWLKNPVLDLLGPVKEFRSDDKAKKFMEENSELMDSLGR